MLLFKRKRFRAPNITVAALYLCKGSSLFCLEFFAGDRASDLGRIFTKKVLTLPVDEGFLFKHTFGKTLRGKNSNTFMVKKYSDTTVCPVSNLRLYVQLCDLMAVNLRDGHLFRTTCNDIDRILFSVSLPVDIDVILYHGNGPCFPVSGSLAVRRGN